MYMASRPLLRLTPTLSVGLGLGYVLTYGDIAQFNADTMQAHGMNHFITSRAYSDCSRTYVWCSTENTVSLLFLDG
jgi:hypothetical protein